MNRSSVFEAAGGEAAFQRLAAAHHERCLQDPVLEHPFSHPGHPRHVERLGLYWAEVLGGPPRFSEECSDQSTMVHIHAGNGAESDLGDRFLACFVAAIDDADLPDDPDLRTCLHDYMAWATADIMTYAPKSATVPPDLSVPHWSWDGLQPT